MYWYHSMLCNGWHRYSLVKKRALRRWNDDPCWSFGICISPLAHHSELREYSSTCACFLRSNCFRQHVRTQRPSQRPQPLWASQCPSEPLFTSTVPLSVFHVPPSPPHVYSPLWVLFTSTVSSKPFQRPSNPLNVQSPLNEPLSASKGNLLRGPLVYNFWSWTHLDLQRVVGSSLSPRFVIMTTLRKAKSLVGKNRKKRILKIKINQLKIEK